MLETLIGLAMVSMSAAQDPTSLKADPRLKASITMAVKYGRIDDVFKQISKSAGTSIRAASSISDAKLTIFVKDLPCGQLLDDIGNVLGYSWTSSDGVLILTQTQSQKANLSSYLEAEAKALRQQTETSSKALAKICGGTLDDFSKALSGNTGQGDETGNADPQPQTPMPALEGDMQENFAVGKLFHDFSTADWDALWKGQVFYTTMPKMPPPGQAQAGGEDQQNQDQTQDDVQRERVRLRRPRRRMIEQTVDSNLVLVRFDAYGTHRLQNVRPPRTENNQGFEIPAMTAPDGDLAQLPFAASVAAWSSLEAANDDPAFAVVTSTQAGIPKTLDGDEGQAGGQQTYGEYRGFNQQDQVSAATMSDQLEAFNAKTGIAVVADGYRITEPPRTGGKTALDWLKNIQDVDHCFIRVEDGVVMARHGGFWRLREYEIPEKLIAGMVAKKSPTLADYAQFLNELTPAQAASLRANNRPMLGFDTAAISGAIPGLKFLGSIGGTIQPNSPISFQRLGSESQQLFLNAIFEGLFTGGSWRGAGPGANASNYGFLLSSANVQRENGTVGGTSLLFGSSKNDGITFDIAIKN